MKILFLVLTLLFVFAGKEVNAKDAVSSPASVVDTGNALCPISEDEVNPEVSAVFEGKKYYFCCKSCLKKFEKNPQKYLAGMKSGSVPKEHSHGEH